jgi:type VI secretion system protein ImpH
MPTLYDHLTAAPYEFDFFAAVRVLAAARPAGRLVGTDAPPEAEIARFRPHLSLAFPPSQLVELLPPEPDAADDQRVAPAHCPLLTVAFIGLYGPSRVLPTHYTQLLLDTQRDVRGPERRALRDWLDLFSHRFTSLFYRAWEKYRFYRSYERGDARRPDGDTFTAAVRCLMGLGSPGLTDRLAVRKAADGWVGFHWPTSDRDDPHAGRDDPSVLARVDDLGLLHYAGFFAQRPRNLTNLRLLLADYFQLPVQVEPFHGQWLPVPEGCQMCFGRMGSLGVDAVVGERVWDVQARFRVRLGPLTYEQFLDLLPDPTPEAVRKTIYLVNQLTRTYVGTEYDFDVQLVLRADAVPEVELTDAGIGPRLGWNMWTISDTPPAPVEDAVFEGEWVTVV